MADPLAFLGDSTLSDDREQVLQKIRLIIRVRWVVSPTVLALLLAASLSGLASQAFSVDQLVVNAVNTLVVLAFNAGYALLLRRLENLRPLVFFQLFGDALSFTLTVYKTGGIASPLAFLYFGVIFAGAVLIGGRSSYLMALAATLLYSLMNLLELLHLLPHQDYFVPLSGLHTMVSYLTLSWLLNVVSFFVMAFLAALLTRSLRRRAGELQATNRILDRKIATLLLLFRTSRALSSSGRVRDVVDCILRELLEFLGLDRALLYVNVADDHLHLYMVKTRQGTPAAAAALAQSINIPLAESAGLTARAALTRQAINVRDPQSSELINRELAQKIGLNPFALAPMVVRGRLVGVIGIDRSQQSGWISDEEFQILQVFAAQAAITIDGLSRDGLALEREAEL